MEKFFNTAGPCDPRWHYMLPAERRLPGLARLIDQAFYFVIHAPRRTGKTTLFRTLARELTASGRYIALLTSCEAGQSLKDEDLAGSLAAVLDSLRQDAEVALPEAARPPAVNPDVPVRSQVSDLLTRWARHSSWPVVLFLDEIETLGDETLISLLRQLRSGYGRRPEGFPWSTALIGLRDVRDYRPLQNYGRRAGDRPIGNGHGALGTASPFNIKVESLRLGDFSPEEVAELYDQHTAATGQPFTQEAKDLAYAYTRGRPWLVNALAHKAVQDLVPDRAVAIDARTIDDAKDLLITQRQAHRDSLIDRLCEPRIQRVIEPILAGELLPADVLHDDVKLAEDVGLVTSTERGLEIANPIYREVIPRALTTLLEYNLSVAPASYVDGAGRLDFHRVVDDFATFWSENADAFIVRAPYPRCAATLVFMAFLHKVVNGRGFIDREYGIGHGRLDLAVRWPHADGLDRWAVELDEWHEGPDPAPRGQAQLKDYLSRLGIDDGTLIVFDRRDEAPPLDERQDSETVEEDGRRIRVLRL